MTEEKPIVSEDSTWEFLSGMAQSGEYVPLIVEDREHRELFRIDATGAFVWGADYDKDEAAQALAEAINALLGGSLR